MNLRLQRTIPSDVIDLTGGIKEEDSQGRSDSASASEDDSSVVEMVDYNPKKRKAQSFSSDDCARASQSSSSSSSQSVDISDLSSEHSEDDDSSVQFVEETRRPVFARRHSLSTIESDDDSDSTEEAEDSFIELVDEPPISANGRESHVQRETRSACVPKIIFYRRK